MAKRGAYTPRSGPLAGTQFRNYYAYQQARAQSLGYPGYSAQRQVEGQSIVRNMMDIAMQKGNYTRTDASRLVRQWYQTQPAAVGAAHPYFGRGTRRGTAYSGRMGQRKASAIAFAMEQGWFTSGDDAADYIDY